MRPNGLLRWLLSTISSRDAADATVGDLMEELHARGRADRRPASQRARLNLRLLAAIGAAAAAASPTVLRTAGLTVRDAWRALRRAPAPSVLIFLILAIAISAATVTFSVVDAVVLTPLPFDHSDQIVSLSGRRPGGRTGITWAHFDAIRHHVGAFESVGLISPANGIPVTIDGAVENLSVVSADSGAFRVLRMSPILGRLWGPEDEARRLDDVAVISEGFWRTHFARDPHVIGRHVEVLRRSFEIIGVLPNAATATGDDWRQDIWMPASRQLAFYASSPVRTFQALARLKPAFTVEGASRDVSAAIAAVPIPDVTFRNWRPVVERWDYRLIGDARGWLLLLLAAVGLVLLTACVNVANVMLAQSAERARDLAVRASFGASRRQLASSVLIEGLLLSLSAGAMALLFSVWGIRAAKAAIPATLFLFRENAIGLNGRVITAGACGALVTGILFGLVPAWQASRTSVLTLLKEGGSGTTGRHGWRSALLAAEVASVGVLLVVSTLFVASFAHVVTLDMGFDRSSLISVQTLSDYSGSVADLKARLEQLPGVTGVTAAGPSSLPFMGSASFGGVTIDTPLAPVGNWDDAHSADVEVYRATADLFSVAGVKFVRGSTWAAGTPPTPRPMVIDEITSHQLFGSSDPIGQFVHARDLKDEEFAVVGVVKFAYSRGPEASERPAVYYAMAPSDPPGSAGFLLRTTGDPAKVLPLVKTVVASAVPRTSQPNRVHLVDEAFSRLTATRRFNAALMAVLALFALVIGAAGIYAVMSSIVAQQTKEIGVRIALGATTGDIRRRVLARAVRHVAAGLVVGLPAGWLISRGFAAQFFQVKPTDASIYVIVAAVLTVVALAAAFVPARRAASVDPVVSLRAS